MSCQRIACSLDMRGDRGSPTRTACRTSCYFTDTGMIFAGRHWFGSIRFGSVIFDISSVRFGKICFPVRRGSACVFRTRRGSVRFGSVRFRVRFRPVPKLNGSVRFGRFGSVAYSFLYLFKTAQWHRHGENGTTESRKEKGASGMLKQVKP